MTMDTMINEAMPERKLNVIRSCEGKAETALTIESAHSVTQAI